MSKNCQICDRPAHPGFNCLGKPLGNARSAAPVKVAAPVVSTPVAPQAPTLPVTGALHRMPRGLIFRGDCADCGVRLNRGDAGYSGGKGTGRVYCIPCGDKRMGLTPPPVTPPVTNDPIPPMPPDRNPDAVRDAADRAWSKVPQKPQKPLPRIEIQLSDLCDALAIDPRRAVEAINVGYGQGWAQRADPRFPN